MRAKGAQELEPIIEAVRASVVEHGLNGASLRVIAHKAATSVGSLSYRVGDRATVIETLIADEADRLADRHDEWVSRIRDLGPPTDVAIADLVSAWLDEQCRAHRTSAINRCELILQAARNPGQTPGVEHLLAPAEAFWTDILAGRPDAVVFGPLLARYCLDELPFSLLLNDQPDYRLLRSATVRALAARLPAEDGPVGWHDNIVGRLGELARPANDPEGLPTKPAKVNLAERIADVLMADGLAALTHRRAAQEAAVPVSSIAHHFPLQRDLVRGGVEAMYSRMRRDKGPATGPITASGVAVILLTHDVALAALREPDLRPFAIDMRRRRGENVRAELTHAISDRTVLGGASIQGLVMTNAGGMIRKRAVAANDDDLARATIGAFRSIADSEDRT